MNLFVFLKGKYGESLILKWVYLIIPIVYEVGVFLIVIMDGVFFDQNNEFFSYTRDISNSVVMHIPGKQHNRSKGTACCSAPSGMMPHDNNSY